MLIRAKMTIELPIGDYHSTNLSTRLLLHKVSLSTPDHNPILYTSFFTDSKSVVHTQKIVLWNWVVNSAGVLTNGKNEAQFLGQSKLFCCCFVEKSISFLETSIRFSFFMEQTIELFLLLMMYLSPFFSIVVRMTQKTILKHLLSLPSSFLGRFSAKNSSSHSIGKWRHYHCIQLM